MKSLVIFMFLVLLACTNGQIRSDYQISFNSHPQAAKYLVFLEERSQPTGFALQDSVDYLDPINLLQFKIAETTSAVPVTVRLINDGKYIRAGLVVEDSAGFYSVMGVSQVYQKGTIPSKPSSVVINKVP